MNVDGEHRFNWITFYLKLASFKSWRIFDLLILTFINNRLITILYVILCHLSHHLLSTMCLYVNISNFK